MKHKFLAIIATLIMIGCTTNTAVDDSPVHDIVTPTVVDVPIVDDNTNVTPDVDTNISTDLLKICTHKYDSSRNFSYLEPSGIAKNPIDDKLTMYIINDINNKEWFINNFELENYNCIKG